MKRRKLVIYFLILILLGCNKKNHKNSSINLIRVLNVAVIFDGGTKCVSYLRPDNSIIHIYVDKRIPLKNRKKSHYGRIYLDVKPDGKRYMTDEKKIRKIIIELNYWYFKNIKQFKDKKLLTNTEEFKKKYGWLNLEQGSYLHILYAGELMEDALKLLKRKYPHLH